MIRNAIRLLLFCLVAGTASAQTCGGLPYTLTNGTTADAAQVMANFNHVVTCNNNLASFFRGWLGGLTVANNTASPNTVIDTSAGVANADDATTLMTLAAFTKNANATWAVGSGNGCLDSGSGLAANTWYHLFVIARMDTGVVDELCSTSATAPTLPGSYTKKRRIGSFKTNASSQILAFSQLGDEFIWAAPVQDVNVTTLGTTATTFTLASVPAGVQVNALVRGWMTNSSNLILGLILPAGESTTTVNSPAANMNFYSTSSTTGTVATLNVRTSTTQQVKAIASSTSTTFYLVTYGWIDTRGRFQ
jgi:hypothetical protein